MSCNIVHDKIYYNRWWSREGYILLWYYISFISWV